MIGRLSGRIDYIGAEYVLLDVNGVGYIVHMSERGLASLPGTGGHVALFTELLVREDLLQLFGFTSMIEKEWHRLLVSVQGIGAKASMAILGTLGPDGISRAIALGDWNAVKMAPGVGPKIAQRVVNELKDKAPAIMSMQPGTIPTLAQDAGAELIEPNQPAMARPQIAVQQPASSAQAEAMSALQNLGYSPSDAASAVAEAQGEAPDADTPSLIRLALMKLAPKN